MAVRYLLIAALGPVVMAEPAAIRYNNPGAQWPARESPNYGMTGYGIIGGNNRIAQFPTPEHGAAANMDLLSRRYVGMTIGDAAKKWSNSGYSGVSGFDPTTVITPEMVRDPNFAVPFFKSISKVEAGRPYPMTDEQWARAHGMFLTGGSGASPVTAPAPTASPPVAPASPVAPSTPSPLPMSLAPGGASVASPEQPAIDPNIMLALQQMAQKAGQSTMPAPEPMTINYPSPPGLARARELARAMARRPIEGAV